MHKCNICDVRYPLDSMKFIVMYDTTFLVCHECEEDMKGANQWPTTDVSDST